MCSAIVDATVVRAACDGRLAAERVNDLGKGKGEEDGVLGALGGDRPF